MYDEFKSIYGETIMAKIFIVEDNPDIIHSTTQELNKWQHDVITVNDWQNVANEILATNPDLVLFDITLPTFDGFYWTQEVRKHSQVPIIVISAAEIDTNVMHAVAAGADDYIMKPFAMTVLLAKIQALLRRNKQTADAEEIMWDHNSFNPLTNILTNGNGTASSLQLKVLCYKFYSVTVIKPFLRNNYFNGYGKVANTLMRTPLTLILVG